MGALSSLSFTYTWRDGSGGFNVAPATLVGPSAYDDGTGGALTPNGTVANNNWTVQRVYLTASNQVVLHYGQEEYANKASAIESIETEPFSSNPVLEGALLRGFCCCSRCCIRAEQH